MQAWIGTIAVILTTVSFIPQVAKSLRSHSVEDLSLPTIGIFFSATLLWLAYGFILGDPAIIITNCAMALMQGILLFLKLFRKPKAAPAAIEHLAYWVRDLEIQKNFYQKYFAATAGELYHNTTKDFRSYFLSFANSPVRMEIMTKPGIAEKTDRRGFDQGLAHLAISVGSKTKVNALTEQLRKDQYTIASEPRTTGDGYYESAVLDPEGNYVEIFA